MSAHKQYVPGKYYVWRKASGVYDGIFPVWDIKWEWHMSEYRGERTQIDSVPENAPFIILAVEHEKIANFKVLTANGAVGWVRINLGMGYSVVPVEG